jgi:hypothetical protein
MHLAPSLIMPGLVPGILFIATEKDRRDKPGDDDEWKVPAESP